MLLRARWVLPVSQDAVEDGAVVVRGGRIHAVGPFARVAGAHPGERLRDLGEAILFPGFVNAHAHLELTLLRGVLEDVAFFPWLRRLVGLKADALKSDESIYYSLLGAAEMIRAGTTTVADCSDSGAPFDALAVSGLRGIVFQEAFAPSPEMVPGALATLQGRLDALEAMATDRVKPGLSPHSTFMACAEMIEGCLRVAEARGLPLSIHAAESEAEDRFVRDGEGPIAEHFRGRGWPAEARGLTPVAWLRERGLLDARARVQLVHLARAGAGDLDLVARATGPVGLAACPRSNARLGNGAPDLAGWSARSLSWGFGTDGAPAVGRCDVQAELAFASSAERARLADAAVLPARELLRRATLEAARSLGLDAITGSLDPGKQADLAAVALGSRHISAGADPHALLVGIATPADVVLTMVGGDVLYDGGEVLTVDETRVAERCRERGELLRKLSRG